MSFSETKSAQRYASIAETAAAEAKLYANNLASAPDYAEQAAQSAAAAAASAEVAVSSEAVVNNLVISASNSASQAAASAAQAGGAAEAAIGQCIRVPTGEIISVLPAAADRTEKFMSFDASGNTDLISKSALVFLDDSGKIPVSMLPAIAMTEPYVVASQAEMLALDAHVGDVAKRTDLGYSFMLSASPASTLGNWVQLNDDILAQLGQQTGAGEIGALTQSGSPTTVQAALNSKANESDFDQFVDDLALPTGPTKVGAYPQGTLAHLQTYVTPEQFGAIGDGTIHPLSERFATLALAQAAYPLITITSLSQTIDWAACQSTENYAVGKTTVKARPFASYHFGRDGLLIDQYSQWEGVIPSSQELKVTEFKKTFPTSTPVFQQDYIVRVKPGNNDTGQFYKAGIRFEGFRLKYDVPRRYPTKGTNTICFHAGNSIKGNFDFSTWGGEYGMYTWIHFGNKGHQRHDNCHKGYFSVPHIGDNERSGAGTTTSNFYRIETDVTPFPITIGRDSYSHYSGYFEGCVTSDGNYDSVNETACGVTVIDTATGVTFSMGVEKWQGVFITKTGAGSAQIGFCFGFFPDDFYKMSSGNDGSDSSIRAILGTSSSRIQIPAAQRAIINVIQGRASFSFNDTNWYMGSVFSETSSTRYLCNLQDLSGLFTFVGGDCGFTPEPGAAPVSFSISEAMKSRVDIQGCRSMDIWCAPSTSWRLIGVNRWVRTTAQSVNGILSSGSGYYADFTPPSGYSVQDVKRLTVNLGVDGSAIGYRPSLYSFDSVSGAARAGTSYTGGTIPTFTGIPEISAN